MLPVVHPIAKTAIQLRQSIKRLETFVLSNPNDEHIREVKELLKDLEAARDHIPGHLLDVDLQEG
jgi:hypothetical protein